MNNYAQLYRDVFRKTNGFMLGWPLGRTLRIGDFFTLKYNNIGVVGNIYEPYFQLNISDTFNRDLPKFEAPLLEPYSKKGSEWQVFRPSYNLWSMKNGIYTNYKSNRFTHEHKRKEIAPEMNVFNTQFPLPGDYFFVANNVHYHRMPHFKEVHKELIRRLTTEFYNFNKIYLITEVAMVSDFSLGVSATEGAELLLSSGDYAHGDIIDLITSGEFYGVEKVYGLADLKFAEKGGAIAFKAKKMSLSIKAQETLIGEIYDTADHNIQKYAVDLIDNELFHLFPKIEINPANANEYFQWSNLALEDIEYFLGGNLG